MEVKDKNIKSQVIVIAIAVVFTIIYVLGVSLTWDKEFWSKDDYIGNIFGPASDSLKYGFSSWTNAIFTAILPLVFSGIILASLYLNDKKYVFVCFIALLLLFAVPFIASIVFYIMMFVSCTPTVALLYNLCFGICLTNLLPFVILSSSTCLSCYHFNTKELIDKTKTKSYSSHYVPGGNRTVKADVKDNSGNVIGTIETQRYEKGYSYTSSETTTTRRYKCTVCGKVTESTTKD